MGILSVRSFFCCDLMTGGISIGLFYICVGFFFLFCGPDSLTIPENIFTSLIVLTVSGCWIYGIFSRKPHFMFPFVAIQLFIYIALAISTACSFLYITMSSGDYSHGIWISLAFCTAIYWYITAVMDSLYKSMKETIDKPQMACEFTNV